MLEKVGLRKSRLVLAIPPANTVPQLERAWLNRRPVAVYFGYTSGILLGRCDRSNERQSERLPAKPTDLPSHTSLTY